MVSPQAAGSLSQWFGKAPSLFRRRMSGGHYRPEIDGLRFFAIAIVMIGHANERAVRFFPSAERLTADHPALAILERGGLGVLLFFAISGFIIATQSRKSADNPLSGAFLSSYFKRRILRIEPPYMLLLVATWLAITLTGFRPAGAPHFDSQPQSLTLSLIGSLFYLHDTIWGSYPRLFPPGWSLEAEVQFYVVAPLLFWAWFRAPGSRLRVALGLAALALSTLVAIEAPASIGPFFTDKGILRFFPFFWVGILLADLRPAIAAAMQKAPSAAAAAIGWLGLIVFVTLPSPQAFAADMAAHFARYAAIAAMFASAWAAQGAFARFCSRPWISLVGGACYSLYLVHLQTSQVIASAAAKILGDASLPAVGALIVLQLTAMTVAGLVFYVTIERFFMIPDWPALARRTLTAAWKRDKSADVSGRFTSRAP
ncbi:MAG: acyltransferase [Hyphomicrobiales bacterium]|nr:acyltransferase [Hyphomicrobiales bacterium]